MTDEHTILLELTKEESIVFFEWLSNFNAKEHPALFADKAEEKVLWDLEASLEKTIPEILNDKYVDWLSKARKQVRDA